MAILYCAALTLALQMHGIPTVVAATVGPMHFAREGHTATLLSNGQVLVAGGSNGDFLAATELYNPSTGNWTVSGAMKRARENHTATLLSNGKVLVAGGFTPPGFSVSSSVELYDPITGVWTEAEAMPSARLYHTATLLTNSTVLVTGGWWAGPLTRAELYDPATGTWSLAGSMNAGRYVHTATLLPGGKVLVVGGEGESGSLSSGEIYDPAARTWTAIAIPDGRRFHTATLTPDGRVLVVGGDKTDIGWLSTTYSYDAFTATWLGAGHLTTPRGYHTATLSPNGRVLILGGSGQSDVLASAEVFNPVVGSWTSSATLAVPRQHHTATLLPYGSVLIVGGSDGSNSLSSAELYETVRGEWRDTGTPPIPLNSGCTTTLLWDGRVLCLGDSGNGGTGAALYDSDYGSWTETPRMHAPRFEHTATLLSDGKVLAVGGYSDRLLGDVESFDRDANRWTTNTALNHSRARHTATRLPDGRVLVTGGATDRAPWTLSSAELYDSATDTWTLTGSMSTPREAHSATLLPNGKVLVVGGPTAELYDPASGAWRSTGPPSAKRVGHSATLLPSGKVMVSGGRCDDCIPPWPDPSASDALASAELYDPNTETWSPTGALLRPRYGHTATLLPGGRVLIAGGFRRSAFGGGDIYETMAELYDPATGQWIGVSAMRLGRKQHAAALLLDGRVLVVGGLGEGGPLPSAELWDASVGFDASRRPLFQRDGWTLRPGESLTLTGVGFRGQSEASAGTTQNSPSDVPVVELRSLENGQTTYLHAKQWTATTYASVPMPAVPPGWTSVTVFVNGLPSRSQIFPAVAPPRVTDHHRVAVEVLPAGNVRLVFNGTVGMRYALEATDDLSPAHWISLSTNSATADGLLVLTNTLSSATNRFWRFRAVP